MKIGRKTRQRGTALITVLIIMVGVIGMLTFLFTLSQSDSVSRTESREIADMQLLLRSGFAYAIDEITTKSDGDTDGLGAVGNNIEAFHTTGALADFSEANAAHLATLGIELTVPATVGTKGRTSLGRFATWIESSAADEKRLHIIAAYPDFVTPARTLGAEYKITTFEGGKNALSLIGAVSGAGGGNFGLAFPDDIMMTIEDASGVVPAINVTQSSYLTDAAFKDFIGDALTRTGNKIEGASTGDGASFVGFPGYTGNAGEDWDTIDDVGSSGLKLNAEIIGNVAQDFLDLLDRADADEIVLGASDGKSDFNTGSSYGLFGYTAYDLSNLPGGVHVLPTGDIADADTEVVWRLGGGSKSYKVDGQHIEGTGTLLIDSGCSIEWKNGATLNWHGDVYFYVTDNKEFKIKDNAQLSISNNFYVIVDPSVKKKTAKLKIEGKGSSGHPSLTVGNTTMLVAPGVGSDGNEIEFHMTGSGGNDAGRFSTELFVCLGEGIDFVMEGGGISTTGAEDDTAKFDINGSMVIGVPEESGGIQKFLFDQYLDVNLVFNSGTFSANMKTLTKGSDDLAVWKNEGYVERSGATKLAEFYAAINSVDTVDGYLGMD